MTNLSKLDKQPLKLLIVGDPGTGKTGSLASLVNLLGLKLRIANLDGNIRPLLDYVDKDKQELVDVAILTDPMRISSTGSIDFMGRPTSPTDLAKLFNDWNGEGSCDKWGLDTVLVIDPLSHLTELTLKKASGGDSPGVQDYGTLKDEILALLWFLKKHVTCHVICIDHLTIPTEHVDMRSRQEKMAAVDAAIPADTFKATSEWKRFPFSAGRALPPLIGGFFDLILHARTEGSGRAARRVLSMAPAPDVDTKCPVHLFGGKVELSVEDGLATFFKTIMEVGEKHE